MTNEKFKAKLPVSWNHIFKELAQIENAQRAIIEELELK